MSNNLILVIAENWEGVYINDDLVMEGHRIDHMDWLKLINKYKSMSATYIEFNDDVQEWLEDNGTLPTEYSNLKKVLSFFDYEGL